jgi:adenylate kinase family enzyme
MKRVSVIGCSGAGKSTLSRALHQMTGLPLVHLDTHFWCAGWKPLDKQEFQIHMQRVHEQDAWIIDGNYSSTMGERLSRSDTVYHLDYPTLLCLRRVLGRIIRGWGRDRSDCGEGCPERFDWEFIRYVVKFRGNFRDRTLELLEQNPHLEVHSFRHPRELERYLRNYQEPG